MSSLCLLCGLRLAYGVPKIVGPGLEFYAVRT
jgi:hypothetical protein